MVLSLDSIRQSIKPELIEFEKYFKNAMKSNVPLLDRITYYIVKSKGKQLRPIFVFLCAKLCGQIKPSSYIAASLIELLHTATLVHDDIVDDSNYRRGFFSIKAIWKNKIAVLVGDFLFMKGFLLAMENKEFALLEIIANSVREMSEGELVQIDKASKLDIDEDTYFNIIKQKTASLISSACAAGGSSTTDDQSKIKALRSFGTNIGVAYQIKDDIFDYGKETIGKPVGIDIKEKKLTLPLIYMLNQVDKSERKSILKDIKKRSDDKKVVRKIIDKVKKSGGIEYAQQRMNEFKNAAVKDLDQFEDTAEKQDLLNLVNFVIERNK